MITGSYVRDPLHDNVGGHVPTPLLLINKIVKMRKIYFFKRRRKTNPGRSAHNCDWAEQLVKEVMCTVKPVKSRL